MRNICIESAIAKIMRGFNRLGGAPGQPEKTVLLLGLTEVKNADPLVNAGGWSYVRVLYPPDEVKSLAAEMATFHPADQFNLLMDAFNLGWSGYAPPSELLDYITHLPPSADPIVLSRAVGYLAEIDREHEPSPERATFRTFALKILEPISTRLGNVASPDEDPTVSALRGQIWEMQARLGDSQALTRANAVFGSKTASPDEKRAALNIVAQNADAATFDELIAQAQRMTDPLERGNILNAVARVADPRLSARFVEIAIGPIAPAGTAVSLLIRAAYFNPDTVWSTLAPHLEDPHLSIDSQSMFWMVPVIAGFSAKAERLHDLQTYADKHMPPDARRPALEAIASIRANIRTRSEVLPLVDRWIGEQVGNAQN